MFLLRRSWTFGAAAIGFTGLWFALSAHRPLFDPDEGRYAEIPREMLNGGDWVIPHLDGLVYLEKPPLQYWLTAFVFRCIGQGEFASRLVPGIAGYLSLAMVFFLARRLWGTEAGIKALCFTAASCLFVLLGHQLTLDMLLSFELLAVLSCFLMAQETEGAGRRRLWMLGCWAAMALAMLTKGLIGVLIPAATLAGYALWQRDPGVLRRLCLRQGLPLFALIAAPWFILAARTDPKFLRFFFVREHFQRFLTPIEHRTEPWWFFAPVLAIGIMPWLPQAARACIAPFVHPQPPGRFDAARLLWVWCVFVLIFFSVSDAKLIPYILPAVPALALLCASSKQGDGGSLRAGAVLTAACGAGMLAYASGRWGSPEGRGLLLLIRPMVTCSCALLILGALLCSALATQNRLRAALASLSAAWFLASAGILTAADAAQSLFSAKDAALALRAQGAVGAPVFSIQSYEQSLPFYLKQTVILVDYRDEFDLGLTEDPGRGVPTLPQFGALWQASNRGYAVMPPRSWDRLKKMGLPMREIALVADRVIVGRNGASAAPAALSVRVSAQAE